MVIRITESNGRAELEWQSHLVNQLKQTVGVLIHSLERVLFPEAPAKKLKTQIALELAGMLGLWTVPTMAATTARRATLSRLWMSTPTVCFN